MRNFLQILQNYRFGTLADPLDVKYIILMQKKLTAEGLPIVPESFLKVLHLSNGITFNDAYILVIFPNISSNRDIFEDNIRLHADGSTLLLGLSGFDFFVYKPEVKKYQILDRDDLSVLEEFSEENVFDAIIDFLKIYDV